MRWFSIVVSLLISASAAAAQPAPVSGFEDEGAFSLAVNEERIGGLTFKWLKDGTYTATLSISLAGQTVKTAIDVKTGPDGMWTAVDISTPRGPVTLTRDGSEVTRTFQQKPVKLTLKPGSVLFDNTTIPMTGVMLRAYDTAKGGKQSIPALVAQGPEVSASLEWNGKEERTAAGRDLTLNKYTLSLLGIDLIVYAGADNKIYLVDVPAQKAAFVRDGYESLRVADDSGPLVSKASFEVRVEHVMMPARDGVKLATDLYLPVTGAKVPAVLVRTPYKKDMNEISGRYYARRGYAAVIQDCRGRFGSEGIWEPFINERKDGYDAVEWVARQPWSNGKVGMIGASYVGWVQWWAAADKPPHLVTIIPNVAPPDPFFNIPYEYGVFFLTGAIWWADILESNATADLSGAAMSRAGEKKYGKLLRSLPVIELDKTVLGKENPYWRKWIQHPANDAYWERANFLDRLKDLRIPVFHQSGWFDGDGIGTKLNYLRMKAGGAPAQKLIVGPWGHTDTASRRAGGRDFGPAALIDLQREYLRWFDYHLKGLQNGIVDEPLVRVFAMGADQWLTANTYPLPQTKFEKWFLSDGGRLTTEHPAAKSPAGKYVFDPGDPTPDPRYYEETEEQEKQLRRAEDLEKRPQQFYEETLKSRKDILVYTSEPMKERYTFVGPVSATLFASTSAKDTDWFMRLVEIDKDGKFHVLGMGKIRARFRESTRKPVLLKPGKIYEYTLDLWHTGVTIAVGSRIRVEVCSAAFPLFSRNLNTGGHNEMDTKFVKADQAIYHDAAHPSHLLLPMIPELTGGGAAATSAK